jgi:hypothetical protein
MTKSEPRSEDLLCLAEKTAKEDGRLSDWQVLAALIFFFFFFGFFKTGFLCMALAVLELTL